MENKWEQYFNGTEINDIEEDSSYSQDTFVQPTEPEETHFEMEQESPVQEDFHELTETELSQYISRISGKTDTGLAKTEITYQAYDYDAPENDMNKNQIYHVTNAEVQISRNKLYDNLFVIDFIFKSCDDMELKLFWNRLQAHLKNESTDADKRWIFYINLLERAGVTMEAKEYKLLTAHIYNPIVCYLTRSLPSDQVKETMVGNEIQGGNIVRMLVVNDLLTFTVDQTMDVNSIKGEVQRDEESAQYLDNYVATQE